MRECERLKTCLFFSDKLAKMPASAELMKASYCYGDKSACARYRVAKVGIMPPPDLFPNDEDRVHRILAGKTLA